MVGAAGDDEPDGDDSVGPAAAAAADRSPTRIAAVFAGAAAAAADHVAADLGTVHLKNLVVVKLQLKRMVLEPSAAGPAADAGTVHWRIQVVARLQLILEHAAALEDSARVGASPSAPVLSVLMMPKTMAPTAAAVVVASAAEAAVVAAGHYFPFEAP